jgi:hypothetical protein
MGGGIIGEGGVHIHMFMFTYHKSNRFQTKSYSSGRAHIYEHATPPPTQIIASSYGPGQSDGKVNGWFMATKCFKMT